MPETAQFEGKILSAAEMRAERDRLHSRGGTLVFTNGCFDLLHAGHVAYLQFARAQGDALCIGLNSDASVRRAKGPERPIVPQAMRAKLLACLRFVDYVVVFDEDEPRGIISRILPDVLVKGRDWAHYVSGRDVVEGNGGRVVLADMVPGLSTTSIVGRIRETAAAAPEPAPEPAKPPRHRPVVGTLAYILSPDGSKVLLVHRTYRAGDENLGKYNGVGGHLERGEGVEECMKREIREETGLEVLSMRLRGTVCWSDFGPDKEEWLGFVFVVDSFRGEPFADNEEGTLAWHAVSEIPNLSVWKGDRLFLPLVFDRDPRPFHGYMRYEGEEPRDWRFGRA